MSNVRVSWTVPVVSARQKAIQHTEISVRVSTSLPWTVQDVVVPSVTQELLFIDVAPGDQFYQAIVVDIDGVRGLPVETTVAVPFDAPGVVTSLAAVIE